MAIIKPNKTKDFLGFSNVMNSNELTDKEETTDGENKDNASTIGNNGNSSPIGNSGSNTSGNLFSQIRSWTLEQLGNNIPSWLSSALGGNGQANTKPTSSTTDTTATNTPATNTSLTNTPVTDTSSTETPKSDTVTTDTPTTEGSSTEDPMTEAPVTEPLATENNINNGIPATGEDPSANRTVSSSVSTALETAANGDETGTGGETGSGAGTGTGNSMAPSQPISREEWEELYGIDADAEYLNAKGALDYEFETWASEYGANAERLYQMGLSNSGVSDIYGSAAYSSYMKAAVELKKAQIEAKRQNKANYQSYVDTFNKTKEENVNKAYTYGLTLYDGTNTAHVQNMMGNAGYDAETVEAAMKRINKIDTDVYSSARVNEAFATEIATYTGNRALIGAKYAGILSTEEINTLCDRLETYWTAAAPNTTVSDQNNTLVIDLYAQYLDQYIKNGGDVNGNIETYIKNTYGENIANDVLEKLHTHDAGNNIVTDPNKEETPGEEPIISDGDLAGLVNSFYFNVFDEKNPFTDSQVNRNTVQRYLEAYVNESDEYVYQDNAEEIAEMIVARLTEKAKEDTNAVAQDTWTDFRNNLSSWSFAEAATQFETISKKYAYTDKEKNELMQKGESAFSGAFNSTNFSNVAGLGIDENTWSEMSNDDREAYLMDMLFEYHRKRLISDDTFMKCINKQIEMDIESTENKSGTTKGKIDTVRGEVIDIMNAYKDRLNDGYLTYEQYKQIAQSIASNFKDNGELIFYGATHNASKIGEGAPIIEGVGLDAHIVSYEDKRYSTIIDSTKVKSMQDGTDTYKQGFIAYAGDVYVITKYGGVIQLPKELDGSVSQQTKSSWKILYEYLLLTSEDISKTDIPIDNKEKEIIGGAGGNGNAAVGHGASESKFDQNIVGK